eukprot:371943_1
MKSIIGTMLAISSLTSGSRLLLQGNSNQPWTLPPQAAPGTAGGPSHDCLTPYAYPPNPQPQGSCAQATLDITRAEEFFQMSCGVFGACVGTTMNFMVTTERIGKVECTEMFSCFGATLNLHGNGQPVTLDTLDCGGDRGCENMKIVLNNADIGKIDCPLGHCDGCMVYEGPADLFPKACNGW